MRQGDALDFVALLERARLGALTDEDVQLLQKQLIPITQDMKAQ